jgi:hypothetical protein
VDKLKPTLKIGEFTVAKLLDDGLIIYADSAELEIDKKGAKIILEWLKKAVQVLENKDPLH